MTGSQGGGTGDVDEAEALVRRLEGDLADARARLVSVQSSCARLHTTEQGISSKSTAAEKVSLFADLFRGRADVYATFWHNSRSGQSGYSPARSGNGSEKSQRSYLSVTAQVIEDHLRGRHIVGVYPLLTDETCWFLAADFDGDHWKEDVAAFVETCAAFSLTPAVERSRSGIGAHVWFFFAEPVPARIARTVGCYMITETKSKRHQLPLTSYDRLFPNQDTLPKGGFGNLIALPMQRVAAREGNTLFLDEKLAPFADQWASLSRVRRYSLELLAPIARDAEKTARVLSATSVSNYHQREQPGLELVLSPDLRGGGESRGMRPAVVTALIAERLVIDVNGFPSELVTRIMRLASFPNPEFYAKERMRLSTHATPRIISCSESVGEALSLPRGCLEDLRTVLIEHGFLLEVEDKRTSGADTSITFLGNLDDDQTRAVETLANEDTGVLVAPPGFGKTVMAIALLAKRNRSSLILVHRRPLLDQWVARIEAFTGRSRREIGQVASGKRHLTGEVDVVMVQSLTRKGIVDEIVGGYGTVIVDECHHVAAFSIERILSKVRARYITGLTATPRRRDGLEPIVHMQLGPVRYVMGTRAADARRPSHHLIVRETDFKIDIEKPGIQDIYTAIGASATRNDLLFDDIIASLEAGRSPIVLTERRDHLEYLALRLRPFTRNLVVLHGGAAAKARHEAARRLSEIPPGEERLILATGRYIGEGFDDPRLDTLFLTMPVAWRGTLVQYAGRLQRSHQGKREIQVYDYVDRLVPVLARMFNKRMRGYRAMGYVSSS